MKKKETVKKTVAKIAKAKKPAEDKNKIRAARKNRNGTTTPMYGTPAADGGFIDDQGFRHEPGTWFASRPSQGEEGDNRSDPTTSLDSMPALPTTSTTLDSSTTMPGGTSKTSPPNSTSEERDSIPPCSPASADAKSAGQQGEKPSSKSSGLSERLKAREAETKASHGFVLTEEQQHILDIAEAIYTQKGPRTIVVKAGAGTGKTFELQRLEEILAGLGQYTAFNKSLVKESTPKFKKAKCNTTYSLAYRQVGVKYKKRLDASKRLRSDQIARILKLSDFEVKVGVGEDGKDIVKTLAGKFLAGQVLGAVAKFCQSADKHIGAEHFRYLDGIDQPTADGKRTYSNNDAVKGHLVPFAQAAWQDLCDPDGQLPFSHAHYVKMWQLGEGKDRPVISADYILLDEYQDTAPVFVSILKQQTHAMLVLVGDDNQRIYEWMGAVNAGDEFPDAAVGMLSQSFRFGQIVADVANSVLARLEEPTELVMKGNPTIPSRVDIVANPDCVLSRTNAAAVSAILNYNSMGTGKQGHLIGGGEDFLRFVRAAQDLQEGRSTDHPELACFSSWKEVEEYSKLDEGADLKLNVKLIATFGCDAIIEGLENMPEENRAGMIACTAHKSKGREWRTVKLASDFPLITRMTDSDVRLLYVAATRAQHVLDVSECPPFCGGKERIGGGEDGSRGCQDIPGLKVTYTVPMPTEQQLEEYLIGKAVEKLPMDPAILKDGSFTDPTDPQQHANGQPEQIFTWSKYGDSWCIRGPAGHAGKTVKVTKKNGQVSQESLAKVVKQFAEACLYEINKQR